MATGFNKIYKRFYSKITDDMYMELDQEQTDKLTFELLENAIGWFEFPRVNINNYDEDNECFNVTLSREEIDILATYMLVAWIDQQLASVELARMKYSGSDFKFTSQANHMAKLTALRKEYERVGFHLQRLYKRRKADKNGIMKSTFGNIMSTSVRHDKAGAVIAGSSESSDEWEDMKDTTEESGGSDSWDDMEDLPSEGGSDSNIDGWGSM